MNDQRSTDSEACLQNQKELWCGNCGFKGSETCNDETTWKRCRLMSSEPEGKNVEDRLELARNSAIEKVLDKFINYLIIRKESLIKNYPIGHDQRDGAQTRISEINQMIFTINAMRELRYEDWMVVE